MLHHESDFTDELMNKTKLKKDFIQLQHCHCCSGFDCNLFFEDSLP